MAAVWGHGRLSKGATRRVAAVERVRNRTLPAAPAPVPGPPVVCLGVVRAVTLSHGADPDDGHLLVAQRARSLVEPEGARVHLCGSRALPPLGPAGGWEGRQMARIAIGYARAKCARAKCVGASNSSGATVFRARAIAAPDAQMSRHLKRVWKNETRFLRKPAMPADTANLARRSGMRKSSWWSRVVSQARPPGVNGESIVTHRHME